MTFDWNQTRAFLATAETGSFSGAARALHQTQPTIGRQVAALEEALDVVLFERVGRKLILTPAGRDMLEHVRAMGEAATKVHITASGRSESIAGTVCVSVTDVFALYTMPAIVDTLRQRAPQIRIDVLVSNELTDLQSHEADIAVRHVRPTQPDLIARKVRECGAGLYAAQKYLDRYGPIEAPVNLVDVDLIAMGDSAETLRFLHAWGLPLTEENIRIHCRDGAAAWEMARRGLGLMPMSDDMARAFPEMVSVLPELVPVRVPYWLTTHRELHSSRRIRLVFDLLVDMLGQAELPVVT